MLSMLESSEIGLKFVHSNFEPFLNTGITLAIFRFDGKIPVEKDKLIILKIGSKIECFNNVIMLEGILKGPVDLLRSREDMKFRTSSVSVGVINIEFATGFFKTVEKCLFEVGVVSLIFSSTEVK